MSSAPEVPEDRSLLVLAVDAQVIAFRRSDGAIAWRHAFHTSVLGLPAMQLGPMDLAFHAGRVFVGARDRVVCIDYASGAIVGQVALPGSVLRPTFLLEGDHLYVFGGDGMLCYDHGGNLVWQSPHGISTRSGPALGVPGNVRPGDDVGR